MAVNLDEKKPSKDKDNMSTKSSTPSSNSNEISIDEKKQNSQETNKEQTIPEVKVDDSPNNDLKKEEIISRSVQNHLSIKVPSKGAFPQLVSSPSEITGAKTPELSPTSPISPASTTQNTNFLKSVGKKLGITVKNSSENGTASNTIPEKEETATSEQQIADNAAPESVPEGSTPVANKDSTENAEERSEINNENQKKGDKKDTPATGKPRMNSIANVKMFITRTSSIIVEKLKEEFDSLDKKIYPNIDPDWNQENKDKLNREQLLENRDSLISKNEIVDDISQKSQSTKNILANTLNDLNERGEKLNNLGEKSEKLSNSASAFQEAAAQAMKRQEQKNKLFGFF